MGFQKRLALDFKTAEKGWGEFGYPGIGEFYITLNESWEVKNGGEFC